MPGNRVIMIVTSKWASENVTNVNIVVNAGVPHMSFCWFDFIPGTIVLEELSCLSDKSGEVAFTTECFFRRGS